MTSLRRRAAVAGDRRLAKVPFVELWDGRLQGVVSSGSDVERVYVSLFEAGTGNYSCATNNNRPCGGLRGSPCKHLVVLLEQAIEQHGMERVAKFLKVQADPAQLTTAWDLLRHLNGQPTRAAASEVFSRFLHWLRFVELQGSGGPVPEMAWFPG